jgi:hypothetical protein
MTIAIIVTACLIILPGTDSEISSFYTNWTSVVPAIIATCLSILTTIRAHRVKNFGKFHFYTSLSLTIGLLLWTSAELGWTYYTLGLGIDNPYPSIADGLWLAGYVGFVLFVYTMHKTISKTRFYDREATILIAVSAGLSLGYVFNLTFGVANIMSSTENELGWLVSILYPILDTVILIPCLLILASIYGRRNKTNSVHWILLTGSIILFTLADIGFDYSEVLGVSDEEGWFWDILYAASYIVLAGAVYSYYMVLSPAYILNQKAQVR